MCGATNQLPYVTTASSCGAAAMLTQPHITHSCDNNHSLQHYYSLHTVHRLFLINSHCLPAIILQAWINTIINERVSSYSLKQRVSLAMHVFMSIYVYSERLIEVCWINYRLWYSTYLLGVIMNLPDCIADVWTVKASIRAVYRFISEEHLCPASCLPVCTAQRQLHARTQAATETTVFWSMTGSTWNITAAVVSLSLRRQPLFVLLSPGFTLTPRHFLVRDSTYALSLYGV